MPHETDQRLKSYLDTNQLQREQMCLAILAQDKRFSAVKPRQPRGGPDGGRDIEATFRESELAYGAVGFLNQANDSDEQKRRIKKKFGEDLGSAIGANPRPTVFVFFTNINLTVNEQTELLATAKAAGMTYCEIFHRERIRIALDGTDGLAARFQYLSIALSETEQAAFFARWGDDIQSVISSGFQRIEGTLDRILFLQESSDVLMTLTVRFQLDREYPGEEIGHFRAFCLLQLPEVKLQIFGVLFGSSDVSTRASENQPQRFEPGGIKYGMCGGQWEERISENEQPSPWGDDAAARYVPAGSSSSVGMDPVLYVLAQYRHASDFFRFEKRLRLRDIDGAWWMPMMNKSLAGKLHSIHVFANGYKLDEISRSDFYVDDTRFDPEIPLVFSAQELADEWVRIRPKRASSFVVSFYERTPQRLFESPKTPNMLLG